MRPGAPIEPASRSRRRPPRRCDRIDPTSARWSAASSRTCASAATPRSGSTPSGSTAGPRRSFLLAAERDRADRRGGARSRCSTTSARCRPTCAASRSIQRESMQEFEVETQPGVLLGQRHVPIAAAGAYVPGGRYPLTASAHMTIVTAKVAGVERVAACTPPIRGEIPAATIAAMHLAGRRRDLPARRRPGGRRHGPRHRDDRPVDLIAGPGQRLRRRGQAAAVRRGRHRPVRRPDGDPRHRRRARRPVRRRRRPAQPGRARPRLAGGPGHHLRGASPGRRWRTSSSSCPSMPTNDMAGPAWRDHGQVLVVDDLDEAYAARRQLRQRARRGAHQRAAREALEAMRNYGALFLGEGTCVSYGDKVIGTNHVLPTRGAARYTGGLWVGKYLKTVTYQEVTDRRRARGSASSAGAPSRVELFEGHARSGDVRAAKYAGAPLPWASRVNVAGADDITGKLGPPDQHPPDERNFPDAQQRPHGRHPRPRHHPGVPGAGRGPDGPGDGAVQLLRR